MRDLTPAWTERNGSERTVLIAGEEFHYRAGLRPEEILGLQDVDENTKPEETFTALDRLVLLLLEPDEHSRWKELRDRSDSPLTGFDIRGVFDGLVELAIGRPPTQPSGSSTPQPEPGMNSTGDSLPLQAVPLRN